MSLCDWILGCCCCCCCSSFIKLCWYIHTVFLYIPLFLLIIIQLALIGSWVLSAVGLIYHTAALLFLLFKQEPPPPPTSQPASPKDIEDRQADECIGGNDVCLFLLLLNEGVKKGNFFGPAIVSLCVFINAPIDFV